MRRRTFLAASAATLALPAVGTGAEPAGPEIHPAVGPGDSRSDLDHRLRDAQPRLHGVRHAVRADRPEGRLQGHAADGRRPRRRRTTARPGSLRCATACCSTTASKVLARDCVASIKRWGARDAFGQALMARTDELSAPDDKTIVFRLKQPFALLPDALCHGASNMCAMMPQHIAETDPFKAFTEVVGSGPFRFKADERVQGSLFVYEKFDKYKPREDGEASFTAGPKIVHFDRVEWHVQPDPATKAAGDAGAARWTGGRTRRPICCRCCARPTSRRRSPITPATPYPAAAEPSVSAVRQAGGASRADGRDRPEGVHDRDDGRGHLALVGAMRLLPAGLAAGERCRHVGADRQARLCGGEEGAGEGRLSGREGGADGRNRPADQLSAGRSRRRHAEARRRGDIMLNSGSWSSMRRRSATEHSTCS